MHTQPALRVAIIAYGNPLRSDDGIGWHAAEILRRELEAARTEIVCAHQLTPELEETASRADIVIFIDAGCSGDPGQVACTEVRPETEIVGFSHRLSPGQLIALCAELHTSTPRGFAVSVAGASFDHGERLSATARAALPRLVDLTKSLVAMPNSPRAPLRDRSHSAGRPRCDKVVLGGITS
jgi:hydrogenase maturation protease